MPSNSHHDIYDNKTLAIVAGSNEYFKIHIYQSESNGNPLLNRPIDLSNVTEIKWLFAPYSVKPEKSYAYITKKMSSSNDIVILKDENDKNTNIIQITIRSQDTINLSGGFLHQLVITDSSGSEFVPFEGIIIINRRIQND